MQRICVTEHPNPIFISHAIVFCDQERCNESSDMLRQVLELPQRWSALNIRMHLSRDSSKVRATLAPRMTWMVSPRLTRLLAALSTTPQDW